MYIKMNNDKSLLITVPTTIYRGENCADLITFLVPNEYGGKNIADCTVVMRYVLPSGVGNSEVLKFQPEMYKNYLQYSTQVDTRLTAERGDIAVWLTAFDHNEDVALLTSEVTVTVQQSKDIDAYLPPETLSQLDQLAAQIAELENTKADDISFNDDDNTVQLLANDKAIGSIITVDDDDDCVVWGTI